MELKAKAQYYGVGGIDLPPGATTEGLTLTEERKAQMLEDFPLVFDVVEAPASDEKVEAPDAKADEPQAPARKTGRKASK
jgi:hypothetical protein